MPKNEPAARSRAYEAIRADADALAREIRLYRAQRATDGEQPPRPLDLAFIRHFQRRLTGIRSRWYGLK